MDKLKAEGIETEIIMVNIRGRTYYRVRIPNFTSRQMRRTLRSRATLLIKAPGLTVTERNDDR
jgi:transposase